MDQHCERILRQIAFGYVLTPSGGMRKMYNHEMISLAREACDQLGIAYSNGACDPFKPTAKAADKFAGIGQEQVPPAYRGACRPAMVAA